MSVKGKLIIVSAPSGAGKDTLLNRAFAENSRLKYAVSATSRAPRDGEVHGVHYYFKTADEFRDMLERGELYEHTSYAGNYYGMPKASVADIVAKGDTAVLKIEVEGAANIRKIFPDAAFVFIAPPSLAVLEQRLRARGTDSESAIQKRLEIAKHELTFAKDYDTIITNDNLDTAVAEFLEAIK
ncbi:MAG: guanylate kinase [Oscillospiraceae bacterium]|jgi:guanylate kinase|nr:guanylate kinase [Oscillospiraceae bacterium]